MRMLRLGIFIAVSVCISCFLPALGLADGMPSEEQSKTSDSTAAKIETSSGAATTAQSEAQPKYDGPKLADFDLARYQYCGDDADCVVAINGCCGCENGAQEVAINKGRLDAFQGNFECDRASCGSELVSARCGGGVVSCIEHKCKFFPAEEGI